MGFDLGFVISGDCLDRIKLSFIFGVVSVTFFSQIISILL